MKRSVQILFYCAGMAALTSTLAIACGPFFSWQLLDNRKQTLLDLPAIDSFSHTIKKLASISEQEKQNLLSVNTVNGSDKNQKTCPQTDDAYKQAASLFHNQQWEEANSAFAMLAYNSSSAQQVCAKYTLGRIEKQLGHDEDAVQSFNGVAYLVAHGTPDPLHLGIAAYGEAAGVILGQIGTRTIKKDEMVQWTVGVLKEDSLSQLVRATELYVKQAALGEDSGLDSIMAILRGLTDPNNENAKALLDQAVQNSLLRKILLAYVLTDEQSYTTYSNAQTQNILQAFIKASLNRQDQDEDMAALAAFAYQNNDMDKAQTFAEYDWQKNKKALDAWVLAKIALRKGDKVKAQEYYHQVIEHLNDETLQIGNKQRAQGERAVLTLSQGNFVQALEELWSVRDVYWGDIVYLAENVLTPDELKQFVNKYTVIPRNTKISCDDNLEDDFTLTGRSMALRQLLARRLMRVGRLHEAGVYFTQHSDAICKATSAHVKVELAYIKAVDEMRHDFWATDRAKAAWEAANILNVYGMQLMGTSGYPDQNPGTFAYGIGQMRGPVHEPDNKVWSVPAEQLRTGVSWPVPNRRFHYRYLAVQDILYAVSLIPHQSQAYAAMLCHANGWMQNTSYYASAPVTYSKGLADSSLGKVDDSQFAYAKSIDIYNLYIKNGAYVPFAKKFGYDCPQPDFSSISKLKRDLFWKNIKSSFHFLRKY